jgi:hypothetical protein
MAKKTVLKYKSTKKQVSKTKKGEKRKGENKKRTLKKRISFKKMSKRKLKSTVKKAKKKIHKQLKYISMKGGSKNGDKMHKEVPQDPNQSKESIESTKAAAEVSNQANIFNELKPNVIESFAGMDSSTYSVFSSQPYLLLGGAKMPKPIKRRRKTMKKRLKMVNRR